VETRGDKGRPAIWTELDVRAPGATAFEGTKSQWQGVGREAVHYGAGLAPNGFVARSAATRE
jgi:hypothetical protein